MKIEMHVHTKYSKDSLLCFWPLYLKLKFLGIDVVAVTEHNNIEGGLRFKEFCKKRNSKIQVIVGDEIFTSQGEVIGLYLSSPIEPGLSAGETIRQIRAQGGLVYVPHPYDAKRHKTVLQEQALSENQEFIDCIEVHNGRNKELKYSFKQKEISKKYSIIPVIGSDAHTWMEIGRNYMFCNKRDLSTPDQFRDSLIYFEFHTAECVKAVHQITRITKAIKLLRKGSFNELYQNIIN